MDLRGAHVLVTGASGGIGEALAIALAARGATLILTGTRLDVLTALADRVGGTAIVADLSEPDAAAQLIARAGRVDVVIANAGLPASGLLSDYSIAQVDRALDVNLRAPIILAKLAAEQMAARGSGHLVFMSSLSGKSASAHMALYNATKFGIRGFALAMRADLKPHGVGVSSVFPGPVRDAGMFANTNVKVPRIGTRTAENVAAATLRAIDKNLAEVTVAPWSLRLSTFVGGVAPEAAATLQRLTGADKIMTAVSEGQRSKR